MEIFKFPHPVLEQAGQPITAFDDALRERVRQMFAVMYEARGVGLAAPQVGWSARLFVMNRAGTPEAGEELVFVNPEILRRAGRETSEEGCLSFPGLSINVARATRIAIRAQDVEGNWFERPSADPMEARILQHEFDHVEGVLFITRMTPADRASVEVQRRLRELRDEQA